MVSLIQVFIAHSVTGWLIVAALCLILELATMSGWLLWPSASAGVVAVVAYLWIKNVVSQAEIFAGLTIINTFLGRRLINREPSKEVDPNDVGRRVVGLVGRASATFKDGSGRVFVDGKEWVAEEEGGSNVTRGDRVIVIRVVDGARLKVRIKID